MDKDSLGRFVKGHRSFVPSGKDNPNWKGGLPRCWCGKQLSKYKYKHCSLHRIFTQETATKIGNALRGKPRPSITGERSHLWRGGITSTNRQIRNSLAYKNWRRLVFERDGYTCQDCGQVGGRLNADHIKPFAYYPELRFDINNGRTLCEGCHRQTSTFAGRIRHLQKHE